MDAVGSASSIIPVLQLSSSVLTTCWTYANGVRKAHAEMLKLTKELTSLNTILESLLELANSSQGSNQLSLLASFNDRNELLHQCTQYLEVLKAELEAALEKGVRGRMTWPLKESSLKKAFTHFESFKATASLALAADHNKLLMDVNDKFTQSKSDELARKINEWLAAPDSSSNYNDARKKCEATTGDWFIKGDDFLNWKITPNSCLWLCGIPGCGKTVLSSIIIKNIWDHNVQLTYASTTALVYFYFDFTAPEKQKPRSMLCSLITQLSAFSGSSMPPEVLANLYAQHQNGRREPSIEDLMTSLKDLLAGFQNSYIVLDALDECKEEQVELLGMLKEIKGWQLGNLHMLVTSRLEEQIQTSFCEDSSGWVQGNVYDSVVDQDIRIHVRTVLGADSKLKKWPAELRKETEETVVARARGMFRLAACQLDMLRKCPNNAKAVRKTLSSLPETLEQIYTQILSDIDKQYRDTALRILQCLVYSARPMSLEELAVVMAVDLNDDPRFDPDRQSLAPEQDIMASCSSLVTMSTLSGSTEVKLAHSSVEDFLVSDQFQQNTSSWHHFNEQSAHTFLTQTTLLYLLQFNKLDCLDSLKVQSFPLSQYSAQHWIFHYDNLEHSILDAMQHLVMNLFDLTPFLNWIWLYNHDNETDWWHKANKPLETNVPSELYFAALLGLNKVAQQLLVTLNFADVNMEGGHYGNALQAASSRGYKEIVQQLLDNGADPNLKGGYYGTALQAASSNGSKEIVQLLLDRGADPNLEGGSYGTALQVASSNGSKEIVQLLLDRGADPNLEGGSYGTALQAASSNGSKEIVQLLLDRGADPNLQAGEYGRVLQVGSSKGHKETVKLLLEYGAESNQHSGQHAGDSVLQAISSEGHDDGGQLFPDIRTDIAVGKWLHGHESQLDSIDDGSAEDAGHPQAQTVSQIQLPAEEDGTTSIMKQDTTAASPLIELDMLGTRTTSEVCWEHRVTPMFQQPDLPVLPVLKSAWLMIRSIGLLAIGKDQHALQAVQLAVATHEAFNILNTAVSKATGADTAGLIRFALLFANEQLRPIKQTLLKWEESQGDDNVVNAEFVELSQKLEEWQQDLSRISVAHIDVDFPVPGTLPLTG